MDKKQVDKSVDALLAEESASKAVSSTTGDAPAANTAEVTQGLPAALNQTPPSAEHQNQGTDAPAVMLGSQKLQQPVKNNKKWLFVIVVVFIVGIGAFVARDYAARQQRSENDWQINVLRGENQVLFDENADLKKQLDAEPTTN